MMSGEQVHDFREWSDPAPSVEEEPKPIDGVGDIQFPCTQCDRVFPSQAAVAGHMAVHNRSLEKEPCPDCGEPYYPGTGMARHRQTQHGMLKKNGKVAKNSGVLKTCPECHKPYDRSYLQTHRRRVHGVYAHGPRVPPKPEDFKPSEWTVDDVFNMVASLLWPDGKMPMKAFYPLLTWRDATEKMLIEVTDE